MFKQVIVKEPAKSYVNGLTTSDLGLPNYDKLLVQHTAYIEALRKCGVAIKELPPSENFPDSTFVEDTAVLTHEFAVIARPGADSRIDEIKEMDTVLKLFYKDIYYLKSPGTLDGGDVLQIDNHFYIGISDRTNNIGAEQLKDIVNSYGYQSTIIPLKEFFHLKTGVSYIGNNSIVVAGEFIGHPDFAQYDAIVVPKEEEYAANCIRVNNFVIVPRGFPKTKQKIINGGFNVIDVEMTEFQKHDGGLSCLSLRF